MQCHYRCIYTGKICSKLAVRDGKCGAGARTYAVPLLMLLQERHAPTWLGVVASAMHIRG
eukprot:scaffold1924_cov119-Skeletonema_marinoi.AAC.2